MRGLGSLLSATISDWYEDRAQRIGAALAYYTIFALTPGLIVLIAVAGLVFGGTAEVRIVGQIRELIGEQGASAIEAMIHSARREPLGVSGTLLTLIPLVFGLWGVFGELQDGRTVLVTIFVGTGRSQQPVRPGADTVQDAQTPRSVPATRPEQTKTEHDRSGVLGAPAPSSPVLDQQPDKGRETGFLFARDPHNALKPLQTFEEGMKADVAAKPAIAAAQRRLLEARYDLTPRLDRPGRALDNAIAVP